MRTVEELEALLEAVTRERDELRAIVGAGGLTYSEGETSLRVKIVEFAQAAESAMRERDMSLAAWESAGMQGRTAQSAMLELARQLEEAQERIELLTELREEERSLNAHFHHEIQAKHTAAEQAKRERDEARDTIVALTTAKAEADLEIATLTAARAESAKWKAAFENIRRTNTDLMMQLFEAQEKVRAVNIEPVLHENAQLRSKVHGLSAEVDRLMHQLADQINETTHWQVMCKRETEEVERLTSGLQLEGVRLRLRLVDEVRSDAYSRGAEAMREACARVADAHCVPGTRDVIRALPIPEEP
jgi:chromosome segregation ATPase